LSPGALPIIWHIVDLERSTGSSLLEPGSSLHIGSSRREMESSPSPPQTTEFPPMKLTTKMLLGSQEHFRAFWRSNDAHKALHLNPCEAAHHCLQGGISTFGEGVFTHHQSHTHTHTHVQTHTITHKLFVSHTRTDTQVHAPPPPSLSVSLFLFYKTLPLTKECTSSEMTAPHQRGVTLLLWNTKGANCFPFWRRCITHTHTHTHITYTHTYTHTHPHT